ncbi:AraC-like DNA-binding protein [Catalinimonas alkaloidigena]|uniref:helix-turn-helix domain-containing protein n=1 Tax=Catalinimonas alkaloidigena TaxID=1075417 RepID=UPI0024069632|nr:AraC family transcriptional regulator [Catalinimonas alkaloidigena]MDF9795020.1 AraC-like DNA-binding protein [Catalinimonas alkaloidigena]
MNPTNILHIKNMVCNRCIMAVEEMLNKLKIPYQAIRLGEVQLTEPISEEKKTVLEKELTAIGFALIDDRKSQIIEKIINILIEQIYQSDEPLKVNLSDYLSERLHYDYSYLSNIFSEVKGITVEKYFIAQKIERVKELMVYNELSLSEIAYQLGYSSVAHLSSQFKKVTGLTPSHFKSIRTEKRKPLDEV